MDTRRTRSRRFDARALGADVRRSWANGLASLALTLVFTVILVYRMETGVSPHCRTHAGSRPFRSVLAQCPLPGPRLDRSDLELAFDGFGSVAQLDEKLVVHGVCSDCLTVASDTEPDDDRSDASSHSDVPRPDLLGPKGRTRISAKLRHSVRIQLRSRRIFGGHRRTGDTHRDHRALPGSGAGNGVLFEAPAGPVVWRFVHASIVVVYILSVWHTLLYRTNVWYAGLLRIGVWLGQLPLLGLLLARLFSPRSAPGRAFGFTVLRAAAALAAVATTAVTAWMVVSRNGGGRIRGEATDTGPVTPEMIWLGTGVLVALLALGVIYSRHVQKRRRPASRGRAARDRSEARR
jgi:hypothetical protein